MKQAADNTSYAGLKIYPNGGTCVQQPQQKKGVSRDNAGHTVVMGAAQMLTQGFDNCTHLHNRDSAPIKGMDCPTEFKQAAMDPGKFLAPFLTEKASSRLSSHRRFTFTIKTSEGPDEQDYRRVHVHLEFASGSSTRRFVVTVYIDTTLVCAGNGSFRPILGAAISHCIVVGPSVLRLSLKQTWSPPGGQAVAGDVRHTCCARVDRRPREEPPSYSSLQQATASQGSRRKLYLPKQGWQELFGL